MFHLPHCSRLLACAALVLLACSGESTEKLIASAREASAKREISTAIIQLKRALDGAPDSAEARALLGQMLLDSGDPAQAEVELRKALERGATAEQVIPALARALLQLGQAAKIVSEMGAIDLQSPEAQADLKTTLAAAHAQQRDRDEAEAAIAIALRAHPMYPAAMMVKARLAAMGGDIDGALNLLDAVLARDPGNQYAGVARGNLLWLFKKDGPGALESYRKVLAAHPGDVAAQAEVVTILFAQRKTAEARQNFELLRKQAPNHPHSKFFEAQFAYVDKEYKRCREILDGLLKVAPDHYRALELAAAAEYQLGNDQQMREFVARALKIEPRLILSRQILAQSLLRAGQPAQAVEALKPLLEGPGADAESLALAGRAYLEAGDARKADEAFKRATELAPSSSKVRTEAALAALSSGQSEVALRDLQAIALGDKGPQADLVLVAGHIAQEDFRGALEAIDGLETKMPGHPLPQQLRGQVLLAMRDGKGAIRAFEEAQSRDKRYFPAVSALASIDMALGQADQARARVKDFLERVPDKAAAYLLLAEIATASGAPPSEAVKHLADGVRASPGDPKAHMALMNRQQELGDSQGALVAAQAAAAALPNDLTILERLGQAQLAAGDAQQAIASFRKLAGLLPKSALPQMRLAEAYLELNDRSAAAQALKQAGKLDPDLTSAQRGLAMLALRENRPQEALEIARAMKQRRPKDAMGYAVEGDILVQQKQWPQAVAAFQAALQRSDATEAAIKLHATLVVSNKAAEADRLVADWLKKRPNDPAFNYYLGDVAMQRERFADAEARYRAVLAAQPRNGLAMNNVAWLLLKQGKPGALDMAARANAALPNRAPILDTLASAQAAEGRVAEAIKTEQQAIAASPQDPSLKLALARYYLKAGMADAAREQLHTLERLGDRFKRQAEVAALLKTL